MELKYDSMTLEELNQLFLEYRDVLGFVQRHNEMDYVEFDYYTVNDLNLFTLQPDFDFELVEETADKIIKSLNAIKKIFSKPILHLKENYEVLPVESVRLINNATIQHIATHSELWDDIKDGSIQPLKLITRIYEDNYGIYENLVFCALVDEILSFSRKSIRFLKNLIYTNQSIQINLLERVNHLNYFLALGKLHTGYIRNFDKYYFTAKRCLNKLVFIYNSILPRLKRPIYKRNMNRLEKLKLRKTNVLSMHKDYHQVYLLLKYFSQKGIQVKNELVEDDLVHLKENYYLFCIILLIFSIGHFNFKATDVINFSNLNTNFEFKKWKVNICSKELDQKKVILLTIKKDVTYKVVLIPSIEKNNPSVYNMMKEGFVANEYLYCTPYENDKGIGHDCCVSISNVESFRRIQQVILRAMIKSDKKRVECPFCNNGLTKLVDDSKKEMIKYECGSCRTQIVDTKCSKMPIPFTFTTIANIQSRDLRKERYSKDDEWLYYRQVESQMYFRNITKINESLEIICPCCNKVHK